MGYEQAFRLAGPTNSQSIGRGRTGGHPGCYFPAIEACMRIGQTVVQGHPSPLQRVLKYLRP